MTSKQSPTPATPTPAPPSPAATAATTAMATQALQPPPPAPRRPMVLTFSRVVALGFVGVLAVGLGVANAILWNVSTPPPPKDDPALGPIEQQLGEVNAQKAAAETQSTMVAAKTQQMREHLTATQHRIDQMNKPVATDPLLPLRVNTLRSDVQALETTRQQLAATAATPSGDVKFTKAVLDMVTHRLCLFVGPDSLDRSGTIFRGVAYAVEPDAKAAALMERGPIKMSYWVEPTVGDYRRITANNTPWTESHLTAFLFRANLPSNVNAEDNQSDTSFQDSDVLQNPTAGTRLYCVGHQRVGDDVWQNAVAVGSFSGTVSMYGRVMYTVSVPCFPGMAGAPVVTADGHLVGIMFGPMPNIQDKNLSLVVPLSALTRDPLSR
ncbi:MAG: trypsin-like peptidase domain-containing protein [Planctomycetota bacterium]